ncbi:MAG TPA: hypothetical protein VGS79_07730, partial [Puia sp.]|nr:hypothetical protein [Puia sp.]
MKNDISEELRSLSALVATISRETPYQAPEGYFVHFPTTVLERVLSDLPGVLPDLPRVAGKPLTFSVPEGYFEGFAQQVLSRIKAGSGPSAGMGEEELLPAILIKAGKITPYTVPEGYFEGLSPILAVAKDKNPYLVPTGYFDGLADEIGSKTAGADNTRSKTRVISLGKRMSWMKYAAAAVVAGLIVTVGWLRWHPASPSATRVAAVVPSATPAEIAKNLSRVSDAELQNYLVDQDTTLAQPV